MSFHYMTIYDIAIYYISYISYVSYISYISYIPYIPYIPYIYICVCAYIPYKPYIPYVPYVPYVPYRPYIPHVPYVPYIPYVPYVPSGHTYHTYHTGYTYRTEPYRTIYRTIPLHSIPCHTISYHTMTWHNICISWLSKPAKEHVGWFLNSRCQNKTQGCSIYVHLLPQISGPCPCMLGFLNAAGPQKCGLSVQLIGHEPPQDTPKHNKRAQFSPLPRDSNPCLKSQAHTGKTQV